MKRYLVPFGAAALIAGGLPLVAPTSFEAASTEVTLVAASPQQGEFGVLKLAKGAEETFYACTACHSEKIVAQQGLTRSGWDELLVWMVEEQDMAEIEEPDRTLILDYLAAHYNVDRPNFPK